MRGFADVVLGMVSSHGLWLFVLSDLASFQIMDAIVNKQKTLKGTNNPLHQSVSLDDRERIINWRLQF